jgi:hypothetical protein
MATTFPGPILYRPPAIARSGANPRRKRPAEKSFLQLVPANGRWCDCACPELVELLVSTHHDVERFAAQHNAVLERVELCRRRDQGGVLRLNSDLLFDADVLAFVFEGAVGFVVRGRSCSAKCHCQAVADAEAGEGLLLGVLRLEGADFEDERSIEYEEVEGYGGRQWRVEGLPDLLALASPA